ncbi:MAG: sugar O-acetyltransferase [Aerococcus sp.]|nr:sugar O-acetyltransferase [Aerococcus sp.]
MGKEFEKMMSGEWYVGSRDPELKQCYQQAMQTNFELNQISPVDKEKKQQWLEKLFTVDNLGEEMELLTPVTVDYGINTSFGKGCYINHHCYFLDCAPISFGDHVFIGPSCQFYTADHPLDYPRRNQGMERAFPIRVGDNVWFGGSVVVTPGVTIGSGSVIGAGSVVTHDVPENVIVAGNPARVIRPIDQGEEG